MEILINSLKLIFHKIKIQLGFRIINFLSRFFLLLFLFVLDLFFSLLLSFIMSIWYNFKVIIFNLIVVVMYIEMSQLLINVFKLTFVCQLNIVERERIQYHDLGNHMELCFKHCLILDIEKGVPVFKQKFKNL